MLVIGGGDGGVVRELNRIPEVKEIVLCEIDEVSSSEFEDDIFIF